MRYSLADLEKRFGHKPNARWSSIANELRREQTAERLREEIEVERIEKLIGVEEEIAHAAQTISNAVVADMAKPSYFDSLMRWVR